MRVVGINGSPRSRGNTYGLLKQAMRPLEDAGHSCEIIHLGGHVIGGCTGCGLCRKEKDRRCHGRDDYLNTIMESFWQADVILLGSPVYFGDVTTEMKACIDRVGYVARSNDFLLKRKLGAAVVAARREGGLHAFDTMNHLFTIEQMITVGSSYWNDCLGGPLGAVEADQEALDTMFVLGTNIAWVLEKLKQD